MNRREFLQSVAALGTAFAIPLESLASAPESVIQDIWCAVSEDPFVFYVNEYGALSSDPVDAYPASRKALWDYPEVTSREQLQSFAEDQASVADFLACEFSDPNWFDDDEEKPEDWQAWLIAADDGTIGRLIDQVNHWINSTPDELDYERATLMGYTGQGNALRFFRDAFEYCDDFDIVVVEGDCPGSSYYAAELHMDLDNANALARKLDIPIRFDGAA